MRPGVTRFCCHWASGNIKTTLILKMGVFVPIAPRLSKIVRIRVFVRTRLISVYHFSSMKQEFLQQPRSITQVVWKSSIQPTKFIVCEYTPPGWAVLNINSFFKDIHANFVHIVRTCRLKTGTKQAAYWQIDTTIPFYACCEPYALSMFRHHNGWTPRIPSIHLSAPQVLGILHQPTVFVPTCWPLQCLCDRLSSIDISSSSTVQNPTRHQNVLPFTGIQIWGLEREVDL